MSLTSSTVLGSISTPTIISFEGDALCNIFKEALNYLKFMEHAGEHLPKLPLLSELCEAIYESISPSEISKGVLKAIFLPFMKADKWIEKRESIVKKMLNISWAPWRDLLEFEKQEIEKNAHERLKPAFFSLTGIYGYKRNEFLLLKDIFDKEYIELKKQSDILIPKIQESVALKIIPQDYLYPLAMETMLSYVKNYTATTWKECVEKFETQLVRWKQEEHNEEMLRYTKENHYILKSIKSDVNFLAWDAILGR